MEDVEAAQIFSESKLSKIEHGRNGPVRIGDVWALCTFYGASDADTKRLTALAEGTRREEWFQSELGAPPEYMDLYLECERESSLLRSWNAEVIHGLAQHPDYTRALLEMETNDKEFIETRIEQRRARQIVRVGQAPLDIILGYSALETVVGAPEVMQKQLRHLQELDLTGDARVRVVPRRSGLHAGIRGPFVIMDFEDPLDPAVVILEALTGARYLEQAWQVNAYQGAFHQLLRQSEPIQEMT